MLKIAPKTQTANAILRIAALELKIRAKIAVKKNCIWIRTAKTKSPRRIQYIAASNDESVNSIEYRKAASMIAQPTIRNIASAILNISCSFGGSAE